MLFSDYKKTKQVKINAAIHSAQLQCGIQGQNPTMLIWLGKVHLGQREHTLAQNNFSFNLSYSKDQILEEENKEDETGNEG